MSASARSLPETYSAALKLAKELLSANHELVKKGVLEAEAEQIVASAIRQVSHQKLSRLELYTRAQDRFPDHAGEKVIISAMARAEGKILQHLTGYQSFLEHEYRVGPGVLVPRPETEILAVEAIAELKRSSRHPSLGVEVGLGSGILSIEMISAFPSLTMLASEVSDEARGYAFENAEAILGAGPANQKLRILRAKSLQVWEPFENAIQPYALDFVISNPPYLNQADAIEPEVRRHEPWAALFAPEGDPLYFYRKIEEGARRFLKSEGFVFLEAPSERAKLVQDLFSETRWKCHMIPDLNLRERVLVARRLD